MKLMNARTDRPVASAVEVAQTRSSRRKGLLGRDRLASGAALVLTPCNAIHTIGMRFPIDVAFVDGRGVVRKIVHNLPPWRMALSPLSRTTIELAAGELGPETLRVGDRVCLVPDAIS
jgi:uncharacterized membrane protein (UPF0127 family)